MRTTAEVSLETFPEAFFSFFPIDKCRSSLQCCSASLSKNIRVPIGGHNVLRPTGQLLPETFHEQDFVGGGKIIDRDGCCSIHNSDYTLRRLEVPRQAAC